ncbi:MAG: zf-HC2 domain-containing protein [Candidatus Aminicenantes bacterium]|nr:zf-HC2 domain-containing protein [Candidatus Aminicenantes bacterium]
MNCRQAERRILRRRDGRLSAVDEERLALHLRSCPKCRGIESEYGLLFDTLARAAESRPQPGFWERLEVRMAESERENGWGAVRRWCRRAVPAALAVTAALLAVLLVFSPGRRDELTSSEALLLRNDNPLTETRALLEENRVEDRNMMLIFASSGDEPWMR